MACHGLLRFARNDGFLAQCPRHMVEQFIDFERARNESLLRGIIDNHRKRAMHFIRVELRRGGRGVAGLLEQPMNFAHDIRMFVGQRPAHHHHMIDRQNLVLRKPRFLFEAGVGKQWPQIGMVGFLAEHRIELAIDQHLHDLLARRRPFGRIDVLGDMSILERHPIDRIEVDTMIIGENAAQPGAGRGGEGTDADALAVQIGRLQRALLGIVKRVGMLKPRHHHVGQQHHRFANAFRHQIGDDRHLRDVERPFADHRLEALVGRRVVDEIEADQIGLDRAVLQRSRAGMVAEQGAQPHRHFSLPPARRYRRGLPS